jgi:hypothetical protein
MQYNTLSALIKSNEIFKTSDIPKITPYNLLNPNLSNKYPAKNLLNPLAKDAKLPTISDK